MRLTRSFSFAALCLSTAFVSAQTTPITTTTVPAAQSPNEMIDSLRLRDAPLDLVIDRLESMTGRIVLRPRALPATGITLNISKPIPKSEAIQALVSVLALNNIGVVEMGDRYLKIVELANKTRSEAPELITSSLIDVAPTGKIASKIFTLTNLKAQEFVPQLNGLLNAQLGGAVVFTNSNSFLITDSIANLKRVEQLLETFDRPTVIDFAPKFYSLRFAKASDLVAQIKLILPASKQQAFGNSLSISADDRTNQIILVIDPSQQSFFDDLIEKLDVKAEPNTRYEVIYLKHAVAKDVSTLLTSVITGQTSGTKSEKKGGKVSQKKESAPADNTPDGLPGADTPATNGNPAAAKSAAALAAESTTQFSSLITVAADDRSNAVIVSGTVDDIRLIHELVSKIDIVLAQVRIEVVIAEVTLSNTDKSGISKLNLTIGQHNGGTQITKFGGSVAGWDVSNGTVNPMAFDAVMNSATLGSKSDVKVLSAPTIVTTHNNEAQIIVGQSQPIITGSTSTPNSTGSGNINSSTVTYKDIAIDLKVTPLIGDDGNIQLKIDQQVNDILNNITIDGNEQPVIGRRQATSFINVRDGEMIVLGGLQRAKQDKSRSKLGFFFEIPVISHLLGARSHGEDRTELLLFIRPHVLPPSIGTSAANAEISRLSNHEQINTYLKSTPFNPPPEAPAEPSADQTNSAKP